MSPEMRQARLVAAELLTKHLSTTDELDDTLELYDADPKADPTRYRLCLTRIRDVLLRD